MKKLLVSGCSITHGAELYNKFMHPKNIELSYSQHLANRLNCELINIALNGSSNEYIFHSIMENIVQQDIHSVIVMWTTTGRIYWKCNNRHYFILGNFASSMIDLVNFKMHDKTVDGCWFTGDNDRIVDKIADIHKFFVTDYFDSTEEQKKLMHYSKALNSVCQTRNIKLISIDWDYILNIGSWSKESRHPNANEHERIAERIHREYYENI